jgi:hypothetical protein
MESSFFIDPMGKLSCSEGGQVLRMDEILELLFRQGFEVDFMIVPIYVPISQLLR